LDKDGLFTGAKIRWETGFDSAYRETLHASCEMEIENQKKSMDQYTHIDGRCQSVTIDLASMDIPFIYCCGTRTWKNLGGL